MKVSQKGIFSKGACRIAAALAAFACAASVCAAGTLPADYTRVVGIQSAGLSGNSPYIDLGYKPTENTWVDIDFDLLDWNIDLLDGDTGSVAGQLDQYPCPFGACHANNALAFTLTGGGTPANGPCWSYRWGNGNSSHIITWSIVEGMHHLEVRGATWTIDGLTKVKDTGWNSSTTAMNKSLYVFARNNNGTMDHPVYMVLYGFNIYEDGVLLHSFVPCVRNSDSEPGLYDVVGAKGFLVKSGTGAFTVVESRLELDGIPLAVSDSFPAPQPIVHPSTNRSIVLVEDIDYTLGYGSRTSSDGYTFGWVKATGIGNYAGVDSYAAWYRIVSQATDAFSVTNISPVAYKDGEPRTLRPVVRTADGSRTLAEGVDYDLSYCNNCEIGRGYVIITGKGDFVGKAWAEPFSILPVLPGGYKAVEWIRSSGTQYIDTGFKPDTNTRADFHFFMEEFGSWSDWAAPFGSRNANSYQFFAGAARQNGRDDWFRRFSNIGTDGDGGIIQKTGEPSVVGEHFFSLNKMTYTLDGYTDTFTAYAIFSKTYNAYVFAVNNNNAAAMHSPMKLYSLKIWDDGTLVRNFVPCVNKEGVAGLYDITPGAVKKFYANDGTGEFEAGPELVARTGFAVYVH